MITLKNDRLCFSFPEIDEALRRLVEQHVNSTLPAIIAADRVRAVDALASSWRFRRSGSRKTPESQGSNHPRYARENRNCTAAKMHEHP